MDSTALDRIATAEKRADEHIFHFRDRLQEVPEAIDRVGQVLLRGPAGQSEHWEKDLSFYSLTQLFGENFFSYEPQQAFACFRVVEASEEEDQRQRNGLLLEQLSEETGLPQDCLELIVDGVDSVLKMTAPEQEGEASFDMAPVRARLAGALCRDHPLSPPARRAPAALAVRCRARRRIRRWRGTRDDDRHPA